MDKIALKETFIDAGFDPEDGDIGYIHDQILNDLQNQADIDSVRYSGGTTKCAKCESLEHENKQLRKEIECYQNSVKARRNATRVWIGSDNGVKFE